MKLLYAINAMLMLLPFSELKNQTERYCVYYNDKAPIEAFSSYDLIVFDSEHHPYLGGFKQQNKKVLGYISLGEVESERDYFNEVKDEGILLEENKDWPGSFYVDVRDPCWAKRVLEEIIPQILFQHFDGLFLDTLDNPADLERRDSNQYKGMVEASAQLVKLIRQHYPNVEIMMNRGYELLPYVGDSIDMVMGESVYADYNFENNTYQLVPEDLYQTQVKILKRAQKEFPNLKVYTLDYWKSSDSKTIKEIYKIQRSHGFIPYVATVDLHNLIPEPR